MKSVRFVVALFLLATPVRADVIEQGPKDSPPSGLLAGVARADITPPAGIAHLNWGSQTHVEAAGIDPAGMIATALVLSDGRQKFAMVDIDAISVEGLEDVIPIAAARTGIPAGHIRLAASHTHAGPSVSSVRIPMGMDITQHQRTYDAHIAVVKEKIVGAILEATSKLETAHLHGAKGTGTININRRVRAAGGNPPAVGRNPEGFVDRDLVVARIDDARGRPIAVLVNFQCHGTVLAYENKLISPDWIGTMRRVVEQALPGAKCLFLQGAAGNQGPVEGFTGDLGVAQRLGTILGHQAAALALGVETVRREPKFEGFVESTAYQAKQHWRVLGPRDALLKFARMTVEVPRRRYTAEDIEGMEQKVREARARLEQAGPADPWKKHQANARLRRFSNLLEDWKKPHDPRPLPVEIQILRAGEVAIVAMPGEPFAEISVAVKKASPFPITMFCGYSTGAGGDYMPIAEEYSHGGYEVERTPYAPESAGIVIREATALLRQIH